ncbi:hypothetical protein BBP40_000640 [Aspergillus hancockii]|nr:hypothetical protein BBP40_000640 [Aspergillus hancockii]
MSTSNYPTSQFTSTDFTDSAASLRHPSPDRRQRRVATQGSAELRHESQIEATRREITEETGYQCRIYHVTMATQAPMSSEPGDVADQPRVYADATKPFYVDGEELGGS